MTDIGELWPMHERFGIIPAAALDIMSELDRLAASCRENLAVLDLVKPSRRCSN